MGGVRINYQSGVYEAKCLVSHRVMDNTSLGENAPVFSFK